MILALDVGNSNIVMGVLDKKEIYCVERIFTDINITSGEYDLKIKNILNSYNISVSQIEGAIISSVVPGLDHILESAIKQLLNKSPLILNDKIKTTLKIDPKIDKKEIGSDLIAAAMGGITQYPLPLVIIDMGTATTFTIIDENSCFLGGMILPGVKISMKSLVNSAAQLPHISIEPPQNFIAKNTIDSMKSGILYSNVFIIDGMLNRIKQELSKDISIIATGGLCEYILPYCENKIKIDNNLILKGLLQIYYINQGIDKTI